ncbi:MAG: hypothetical protein P9M06_07720, partial [Candidatus Saelkia tenebricola]|nr:hypothetical protein [Candidatus Saelkia tenebricola]
VFAFLTIFLGLGLFSQLRGGRDTGPDYLKEFVKEDFSTSAIVEKAELDTGAKELVKEDVKVSGIKKRSAVASSVTSSFNTTETYQRPEYIKNIENAGIEVKKHKEMSSVGKVATEYYEKEGFPVIEGGLQRNAC